MNGLVSQLAFQFRQQRARQTRDVFLEDEEGHVDDAVEGDEQRDDPVAADAARLVRNALVAEERLRIAALAAAAQNAGTQLGARVVSHSELRVLLAVVLGTAVHADRCVSLRAAPVAGVVENPSGALRPVRTVEAGHDAVGANLVAVDRQLRDGETVLGARARPAVHVQALHAVRRRRHVVVFDGVAGRAGEAQPLHREPVLERVQRAVGHHRGGDVTAPRARRDVTNDDGAGGVNQIAVRRRATQQRTANAAVLQRDADSGGGVQGPAVVLRPVVVERAAADVHQPVVRQRRDGRQRHVHGAAVAGRSRDRVRVRGRVLARRLRRVAREDAVDDGDARARQRHEAAQTAVHGRRHPQGAARASRAVPRERRVAYDHHAASAQREIDCARVLRE